MTSRDEARKEGWTLGRGEQSIKSWGGPGELIFCEGSPRWVVEKMGGRRKP